MINVPLNPLLISEIDNKDPFVLNALKERKHYEACWCGSGKKYKKCHRKRGEEKPYTSGKILNYEKNFFWKRRGCMHPSASSKTCKGKIIDSHTIQRKGPLKRIINSSNHVMHFKANQNGGPLYPRLISWKKASTFPGFCSFHDSSLFSSIEKFNFTGDHKQCVLHAFRNICNGYYKRNALIESLEFLRGIIDRGMEIDHQICTQFSFIQNIKGQTKSLEEIRCYRDVFEEAIDQDNYDKFESACYFFNGDINVVSSSILHCEFDFSGKKLIDMWDLSNNAEMLSHTVVDTDQGGVIIFVWLKGQQHPKDIVESFANLPNDEKGDIFVQYCFVNSEDTFFSEQWWGNLDKFQQSQLKRYASATYYEGGSYTANEKKLVDWIVF